MATNVRGLSQVKPMMSCAGLGSFAVANTDDVWTYICSNPVNDYIDGTYMLLH
jgi:hypothetical protein